MTITIVLENEDADILDDLKKHESDSLDELLIDSSFDGSSIIQAIINISNSTIPIIVSIIIAIVNRNRTIKIVKNGVEIIIPVKKELTTEEAMEIIDKYATTDD
jgi:hypothetical protein